LGFRICTAEDGFSDHVPHFVLEGFVDGRGLREKSVDVFRALPDLPRRGLMLKVSPHSSATFRGGGGHCCGTVPRFATSQGLRQLSPRCLSCAGGSAAEPRLFQNTFRAGLRVERRLPGWVTPFWYNPFPGILLSREPRLRRAS